MRRPKIRIGSLNEGSLHASLKEMYRKDCLSVESEVDGFIVDIVRTDSIVEIQTGSFWDIKSKIVSLLPEHRIILVYPIAVEKKLTVLDVSRKHTLRRRQSPKHGCILDIVDEIIHIPEVILHPHLTLEVLLTHEEQIRVDDGLGSWRRGGVSILDRRLLAVVETHQFTRAADYLALLPEDLPETFSNRSLADLMGLSREKVRKVTYCFKHMGLFEVVGKSGNSLLFRLSKRVMVPDIESR